MNELRFDAHAPRIGLSIAGVRIDLLTRSESLQAEIKEYFSSYLTESGDAAGEIFIEPLPGGQWEDIDPEFELAESQVVQRDFVAKRVDGAEKLERAAAWTAPGESDAIHNLLRWFYPRILLRNRGFLLHGAGVIRRGEAYVFFGHSGAGKSTSVRLIAGSDPEVSVLGDDAVIIRASDKEVRLFSAPLGCGYSLKAPPNLSAPIRGLYALKQSGSDQVLKLPLAAGAAQLLASAMCPGFDDQADERLDLAAHISAVCGISQLRFRKSPEFWRSSILSHTDGGRYHEPAAEIQG